jgi:hypothetical protein
MTLIDDQVRFALQTPFTLTRTTSNARYESRTSGISLVVCVRIPERVPLTRFFEIRPRSRDDQRLTTTSDDGDAFTPEYNQPMFPVPI